MAFVSPSPSRLQNLPQPVEKTLSNFSFPFFDILPQHINQSLHYYDQDVVRELSIPPEQTNSVRQQHPVYGSNPLQSVETSRFPSHFSQHVSSSINLQHLRPRTPSVNFTSQHGLPSFLPPPPRTTFVAESSNQLQQEQEPSDLVRILDSLLRGSYNNMLATKLDINGAEAPVIEKQEGAPVDYGFSFDDMLNPEAYVDFLTSPQLDQSPETPFIDTPADEVLPSPSLFDEGLFNYDGMPPPFGSIISQPKEETCVVPNVTITPATPAIESFPYSPYITSPLLGTATSLPHASKVEPVTPALPALEEMYSIPETSVSPSSFYSPAQPPMLLSSLSSSLSSVPSVKPSRPTKSIPTGTRRGISASSLVPIDAPTQSRNYATPSATSRKLVPAAFKAKKRARSEIDGEEAEDDDDDTEQSLDPNMKDAIEAKRRQNTLAARRSRQRKLEHTRELQDSLNAMTQDRDMWMRRAYDAENKLRVHGLS